MKRKSLKPFALLMSMVLVSCSVSANALTVESTVEKLSVDQLQQRMVFTKTVEMDTKIEKSVTNIQGFKQKVQQDYPEMSDLELAKTIRLSAGEDLEVIEKLPDDIVLAALDYDKVVTNEMYMKSNEDGSTEVISKAQCANEIAASESIEISVRKELLESEFDTGIMTMAADDDVAQDGLRKETYDDVKGNGYMKIVTTAARIEKNLGGYQTWLVSGRAKWLKEPNNNLSDSITIACTAQYYDPMESTYTYGYKTYFKNCIKKFGDIVNHKHYGYYTVDMDYEMTGTKGVVFRSPLITDVCDELDYDEYNKGIRGLHKTYSKGDSRFEYYGQYPVRTYEDFSVLVAYGHNYFGLGFDPTVTLSISGTGPSASIDITFGSRVEEYKMNSPMYVSLMGDY